MVLLVTCSIREKAEDRIWSRLEKLKQHKDNYHVCGYPKIGILGKLILNIYMLVMHEY